MSTEYILTIHPDGSIEKKIEGIEGPGCFDDPLSKRLDATFGRPVKTEPTAAYYAQGAGHAHVDSRG